MRYKEIKRLLETEELDEVRMGPSDFQRFANSTEAEGIRIGIEFEMCVPGTDVGDDEPEWEYDYDQNERAWSIDDIINFFENGEFSNMGPSSAQRAREKMWDEFLDWQYSAISNNLDVDELADRIRDRLESELDDDEYIEKAREELGDEVPDTEVEQRADELKREAVDELMGDSSEYDSAYDEIREEMEEDMRNDSDYDEEAWLSDIGVSDMQDAERYWGYDWPHMYNANEGGGGADIDDIANDFEDATDYRARGYSGYHSASRETQQQEGYWVIEPDSSIDAERGDAGLEFISPALPLKDGLEAIKRVKEWAKSAGCYTNKSTGLHMNISVPNMTTENLDYVKLALFLGDKHVLEQFGRSYNTYCKSAMDIVKQKIQENPENVTALLNKMKEHINTAASKLIHSGVTHKYTSINTKGKYVEFRGPGGDYLDQDLDKLTNTALRLAMALNIAADDNAYKKEYAKKLYKLVSKEGEWTDPNHSVALFTRYATGEIKKAELLDNIRQARVARQEKKGPEQQYWVMNKDDTGGKQMVFAQSSTDAIIKGGKQLGLNREQSISRLKAVPFEASQDNSVPESVPTHWKEWIQETLPAINVDTINSVRVRITSGGDNLEPDARGWVIKQIDNELRRRMDQGVEPPGTSNIDRMAQAARRAENEVYQSLPEAHRNYLDTLADKSDMSLINVFRNLNTSTTLNQQQAAYCRVAIKHELRRRGIDPSEEETSVANKPVTQNQARDLEHEIEPESGKSGVRAISNQIIESINILHKLAGL